MKAFFDSIKHLTSKQLQLLALQLKKENDQLQQKASICIVGMSARAGDADGLEAFWASLEKGRQPRVQSSRLGPIANSEPGVIYMKGAEKFDANFFGFTEEQARATDPQQRVLLRGVWQALEDAGIPPSSTRDRRVGVYVAAQTSGYHDLRAAPERVSVFDAQGGAMGNVSGKISSFFHWLGPSLVIDTACSSSLVAASMAHGALSRHEVELAIVAGINLCATGRLTYALAKAGILSPNNRSRPFHPEANGYVRSEGCGVLVLARDNCALIQPGSVWAELSSLFVNQDGHRSQVMVPKAESQVQVMREALRLADCSPAELAYVEANAIGSSVNDWVELESIRELIRGHASDINVSSLKSVVGHSETAAGVLSLIRAVLAVSKRDLQEHLCCSLEENSQPSSNVFDEVRRTVLVNAFSLTGTNASAVVRRVSADQNGTIGGTGRWFKSDLFQAFNEQYYWIEGEERKREIKRTVHLEKYELLDELVKFILSSEEEQESSERFNDSDTIFGLGLSSVEVRLLYLKLKDRKASISLLDLFRAQAIGELSEHIRDGVLKVGVNTESLFSIESKNSDKDVVELTDIQKQFFVLEEMGGCPAYNLPLALDMGYVSPCTVLDKLHHVLESYVILNSIVKREEGCLQFFCDFPPTKETLEQRVSCEYKKGVFDRDLKCQLAHEFCVSPFDLGREVWRARIYIDSSGACFLVLVIHHTVCDGWSLGLIANSLLSSSRNVDLIQFEVRDCIKTQRTYLLSDEARVDRDFWSDYLKSSRKPALPYDREASEVPIHLLCSKGSFRLDLSHEESRSIDMIANSFGASSFLVLESLLELHLLEWLRGEGFTIGIVDSGRNTEDDFKAVGCFINFIVKKCVSSSGISIREFIERNMRDYCELIEHGRYPFLRAYLDSYKVVSKNVSMFDNPFFNILVQYEGYADLNDLHLFDDRIVDVSLPRSVIDLRFVFARNAKRNYCVVTEFDSGLFDVLTIEHHMREYYRRVADFVAQG